MSRYIFLYKSVFLSLSSVKRKMIAFIKKNPMFGRKYIRGLKNRNQDDILNAEISNMFIFGLDENSPNYTGKGNKFYTHIDETFDNINISNIHINESLLLNDPYSRRYKIILLMLQLI